MLVLGVVILQVVMATVMLVVVMLMTVVVKVVMIRRGHGGGDVVDGDGDDVCSSDHGDYSADDDSGRDGW